MIRLAVALLLAVVQGHPVQSSHPAPQLDVVPIRLQLGVRISPDTVTVGQRFIVVIKVSAPAGALVDFPATTDSVAASPTGVEVIGKPLIQVASGSARPYHTAAYRMTAWDTGPQPLLLGNVVVRINGQTGYVSLAGYRVNVRSVLPPDSALRVPKPPREKILIQPLSEIPWLLFFLALLLALIAYWLWQAYRRRRDASLDPFAAAQAEFARIEAMNLVGSGDGDRHVTMMVDTMRAYLSARVSGIHLSHTSSEVLAAAGSIQTVTPKLGELLWQADLVKFARHSLAADEALDAGSSSRSIVQSIEAELVRREAEAALAEPKRSAPRRAA
ncbi:MAG: hypothetical protein ABIR58_03030 [Gemmatimonadaceae bacterium]